MTPSTPTFPHYPKPRGIVVFGGGTATNSLVDVFERIREQRGCSLSYVIPISDNGGSSSELIRMFGGPGIGDVRSRLVRLIPGSDTDPERHSLKELFNHRLSSDPAQARLEWLDVVEGRDHRLWRDISSERRELIRSIFNLMNLEIVKRARPTSTFSFAKASIGNLFLTGARLFTGSLESSIYLLSTICSVPSTVSALPVINSNFTHHISAGLADGTIITGQNSISHPSAPTSLPAAGDHHETSNNNNPNLNSQLLLSPPPTGAANTRSPTPAPSALETETAAHDLIEDATLPGSLPTLRKPYINFRKEGTPRGRSRGGGGGSGGGDGDIRKDAEGTNEGENNNEENEQEEGEGDEDDEDEDEQDLPTRIDRIWYINPYGHEIRPVPNPKVLAAIRGATAVVYSIGSLYTSIMPSLILRGVGDAIAGVPSGPHQQQQHQQEQGQGPRYKILILNSANDRETGPRASPFTAADFVRAIARGAGPESRGEFYNRHLLGNKGSGSNNSDITPAIATADAPATTETIPEASTTSSATTTAGTTTTTTNTPTIARTSTPPSPLLSGETPDAEKEKEEVRRYVTHIVYLEDPQAPRVDREELQNRLGVECVRVYGRRDPPDGEGGGMLRYDEVALMRALEAIVGGRPDMARSRRNTSGQ